MRRPACLMVSMGPVRLTSRTRDHSDRWQVDDRGDRGRCRRWRRRCRGRRSARRRRRRGAATSSSIGHVAADRVHGVAQLGGDVDQRLLVDVADDDPGAVGDEPPGGGEPDARGTAGHEGDPAGEAAGAACARQPWGAASFHESELSRTMSTMRSHRGEALGDLHVERAHARGTRGSGCPRARPCRRRAHPTARRTRRRRARCGCRGGPRRPRRSRGSRRRASGGERVVRAEPRPHQAHAVVAALLEQHLHHVPARQRPLHHLVGRRRVHASAST